MAIEVRDGVEGKVCSRCGWKPTTDFWKNAANADALQGMCKTCLQGHYFNPDWRCSGCGLRRGDCKDNGGPLDVEFGRQKSHCKLCHREQAKEWNRVDGRLHSAKSAGLKKRRARLRGAEGEHTQEETALLKFVYGETCPTGDGRPVGHVDHVEPLAGAERNDWEGTDWVDNLQWLCVPCNLAKSDKNNNDFRPDKGAAARAILRLELYKVRNTRDRKLYTRWIMRRLEPYTTLEDKTRVLLAISVRDAYEVGQMVKQMLALQAQDEAVYEL